jgi:hypothetical protein
MEWQSIVVLGLQHTTLGLRAGYVASNICKSQAPMKQVPEIQEPRS